MLIKFHKNQKGDADSGLLMKVFFAAILFSGAILTMKWMESVKDKRAGYIYVEEE